MGNFVKTGNVDVVALGDIWASQIDKAKQNAAAANAKTFEDHRKLLDMKEVDVALIGVPDHWHVPIAIDALNAGKDVYVEKPLTLDGRRGAGGREGGAHQQPHLPGGHAAALRQALHRKPSRNTSTPARSARSRWRAPGGTATPTICAKRRHRCRPSPRIWTGRTTWAALKWRDWDPQQYWNWRAYLDFGGGQVTDLFTHWIDVVHMFMGQDMPIVRRGHRRRLQL